MRPIKTTGACLALVFAFGAMAAASASALSPPEFGQCRPLSGGGYKGLPCNSMSGTLNREWYPNLLDGFEDSSTTSVMFSTVNGTKVECAAEIGEGVYTGSKMVELGMGFEGCKMEPGHHTCTSVRHAGNAGEILSTFLEGELGVEQYGTKPVQNKLALDFKPYAGTTFLEPFTCTNGDKWEVKGELMVTVPANDMQTQTKWVFHKSGYKQIPEKFAVPGLHILEGKLDTATNTGAYEQMGVRFTVNNIPDEEIEANSVY